MPKTTLTTKDPQIGVLVIGDELVDGSRCDLHTQWLAKALHRLGLTIETALLVRDNEPAIMEGLSILQNKLKECPPIIFTSGGLGPTSDDITTETIAKFYQWRLVLNSKVAEGLKLFCQKIGIGYGPGQEKQCYFPEGAQALFNSLGTAAGFIHQKGASPTIIVLPGPPHELQAMFHECVEPFLKTKFPSAHVGARVLQTYDMAESKLAELVQAEDEEIQSLRLKGEPIRISYREKRPRIFLKIEWKGAHLDTQGEALYARCLKKLQPHFVLPTAEEEIQTLVIEEARKKGITISTAESCTGGGLSFRLTDVPGSSAVITQNVVTYSNESKSKILNVSEDLISKEGAVSEAVAKAMAQRVCEWSGSSLGVGITGIAGPSGGTAQKPVGTIYIAIFEKAKNEFHLTHKHLRGDRSWIRQTTIDLALNRLLRVLMNQPL